MATISNSGTVRIAGAPGRRSPSVASARLSRAALALGGLGIASSMFVIARLVDAWRITRMPPAHQFSILGLRLSYPSANVDAVVVLALAVLGLAVIALLLSGVSREWLGAARLTARLSRRASPGPYGALLLEDEQPMAFCAGLLRPRIYLTTGAVAMLDTEALEAVLAHERHHAKRRDPLRFATERVLARSLFFVPGVSELMRRHRQVAELSADESAVSSAPGNRVALARAMLSFSDNAHAPMGVDPVRVDYLLGESAWWGFPLILSVAGVAVLALLVAIATLAGRVAAGSATLSVPLLSRQPCVVVLAIIPVALGALAVALARRARR